MLSSVLNSERAIQVNIQIIRTFIRLRELMLGHDELKKEIEAIKSKFEVYDQQFEEVFEAIGKLLREPEEESGEKIGFK